MTRVKVPVVDANVDAVTITQWLKAEGDAVKKGEPLVELTTEKACFELESPASGILRRILAPRQSVVPVGYVIALVGRPEEPLPDVSSHNTRLMERLRDSFAGRSTSGHPRTLRVSSSEAVGGAPRRKRSSKLAQRPGARPGSKRTEVP